MCIQWSVALPDKGWNSDVCYSADGSWGCFAKWNRLVTKEQALHDFTSVRNWGQSDVYKDLKQRGGLHECGGGGSRLVVVQFQFCSTKRGLAMGGTTMWMSPLLLPRTLHNGKDGTLCFTIKNFKKCNGLLQSPLARAYAHHYIYALIVLLHRSSLTKSSQKIRIYNLITQPLEVAVCD